MDMKTFGIAIVLGFVVSMILGGLLNFPDAGAIVAIAFVGGRIVGVCREKEDDDKQKK